jgi:hypothetical protein
MQLLNHGLFRGLSVIFLAGALQACFLTPQLIARKNRQYIADRVIESQQKEGKVYFTFVAHDRYTGLRKIGQSSVTLSELPQALDITMGCPFFEADRASFEKPDWSSFSGIETPNRSVPKSCSEDDAINANSTQEYQLALGPREDKACLIQFNPENGQCLRGYRLAAPQFDVREGPSALAVITGLPFTVLWDLVMLPFYPLIATEESSGERIG